MSITKAKGNSEVLFACPVVGIGLTARRKEYLSPPTGNPRFDEPTSPLSRIIVEAPYLPRCSDNKTAALIRPVNYAVRYPYMQVNRSGMVSWLVFDLDHDNPLSWEDANLPSPNLIVTNRQNGHSHVFYAIRRVCTTENARSAPIQYMKSIYEAMAARMNADPAYSGPVAKTPGHPWWNTWELHNHEYELGELADSVELPVRIPWGKGPDLGSVAHSRHCLLFEETRFYAYSIVNREREQGTFKSFSRLVEAYAYSKNSFKQRGFTSDLTVSQVKATVKSISRWTWDHYQGNSACNRGVMGLGPNKSLSLPEKQKLAAKRTHKTRQKATESKIRRAYHSIVKSGETVTQMALAKHSGLSRQTIAKYKELLTDLALATTKGALSVVSIEHQERKSADVKYGVYQIPAPGRGDRYLGGDNLKSSHKGLGLIPPD